MDKLKISLPIAQKPWNNKAKKLESACRKALYDFDMLKGHDKIAIALSGGKDSLSLLFLLSEIRGRGFKNFELYAIHITGEFSCGAGISVPLLAAICNRLNVPFIVKEQKKREKLECYSCSRDRRTLLFEAAKEKDVHCIAFGHHRDDVAQTVLMNLFHKAEFEGMHPNIQMQKYGVRIIRPLYYIDEDDIKSFAAQYGFARISCQCPVGQNSMRKKTQALLKDIEILYPNARLNLAYAADKQGSKKSLTP
ncbi:Uncharacterized protein AB751O23_AA_00030 [Chlamydiales bacterium SCGC AB-751-O23]|jgi:tRNA 2-thiocytidine biosynthesis protein TtcA|nr:Uncharacterized protein AB751O23_AA_00030 [Chlamydiales bacterium SCGC AB-751-O23]